MAEEQPKDAAKDQTAEVGTKCAFSGVRLRKVKRYYRNGQYYINKRAYQEHAKQLKDKAREEKDKASAEAASATPQPEVSQPEASQPAPETQDNKGKKE